MVGTIKTPHLPKGRVRNLIIGEKYEKLLENAAIKHNFELICLKNNQYCDERLSGHTDLAAVHIGGNELVCRRYLKNTEAHRRLNELGVNVEFVDNCLSPEYPDDASLNFCVVGSKVLMNPKTADAQTVKKLTRTLAYCKQGYTKCTVCVVDENSIITEDKGVSLCARNAGIEVLEISSCGILLDGYPNGFIGGASFKLAPDILAFTGAISDTYIMNEIETFLSARNIKAVYLNDTPAIDIGSAIPITEEVTDTVSL